ncbi:MAG TPA: hypothetical protein PKD54_09160 [Pirellulaceae bacterium]|nr:hypothetical protein [Pirellulaceae bacterium]
MSTLGVISSDGQHGLAQVASPASTVLNRDRDSIQPPLGESFFTPADQGQLDLRVKAIQQRIEVIKDVMARQQEIAQAASANQTNSLKPDVEPIPSPPTDNMDPPVGAAIQQSPQTDPEQKVDPAQSIPSQNSLLPLGGQVLTSPLNSKDLADSLVLTGNHAQALRCYEALVAEEQDPETQDWLRCLNGNCHRVLGHISGAERLYRDVVTSKRKSHVTDHARWYLDHVDRLKRIRVEIQAFESELQSLSKGR